MSDIKTPEQIKAMHRAGKILAACHQQISKRIRPGVSTLEIDRFVEKYLKQYGATAEQKGYMGYPNAICASVNDVICHGIPNDIPLKEGDIVTIDFVVNKDGWLADSAWSYAVGKISKTADHLMKTTLAALKAGISQAKPGNRIGHISHAIQEIAKKAGFSVVQEFVGHGIGQKIHEPPAVPHFGPIHSGELIREGMVFTIEPMLNVGSRKVTLDDDGWTARTVDGSLSAQYEHTLAIQNGKPLILTEQV